jgi:hypothetical protein
VLPAISPPTLKKRRPQELALKALPGLLARAEFSSSSRRLSLRHWDQKRLYSTFLAVLAVACSTGLETSRAIATYISPSFDISDIWVSYAFLAH